MKAKHDAGVTTDSSSSYQDQHILGSVSYGDHKFIVGGGYPGWPAKYGAEVKGATSTQVLKWSPCPFKKGLLHVGFRESSVR